jgi:predicted lipoprotein with Yx(FWY)xxD motif
MTKRTMGLLVAVLLVVAACGGDAASDTTSPAEPDATTTEGDSAQEQATTSTEAPAEEEPATTAAAAMDGIHVADTELGEILVDPDGFTLYIFTADSEGESTCYDGCAELWPPIPADTPISSDLDASMFGATTRTDGMEQLTVGGMPLYLYTPDTSPGDVSGQGLNGVWFVVDGDGTVIEAAAADEIVIDYGY